jgi:nicotinamide riboside transporter PnuC
MILYWLTSLAALLGVVLNIRQNRLCFPIWAVTNSVWAVADWTHGLYPQAVLMAVYAGLAIYGAWAWRKEAPHGR